MPVYQHSPMWNRLFEVPAELTPLYAVLTVLHQAMSGKPAGSCALACHQISGALHHLGFPAEPIAACATLYRTAGTFREESDLGVWQRPPTIRPDGTTTGHMIVWAPSFAQVIDPTLVQHQILLSRAATNPVYSIPVCAPAPAEADALLRARLVARIDEDLYVSWLLQPDWTDLVNAVLDEPLTIAAELGGLSLATDALDVLYRLVAERDLDPVTTLSPRLNALLAGTAHLPPMPDEVPPELRDP
ncbi:hypothetical protein EDC02_7640 [Micromonospora sp. Llam0]|uniref:hypothetical protein n=1 Tax=Micromonospora sp. Llam0 TaxID=2485143 RepID=UPI000FBCF939|nr:hypothetical protein [Micromonospora sp. Llam0]ROO52700.1 hypothetical protein EDC02_7640 [Micromonospora sp. Llam0]